MTHREFMEARCKEAHQFRIDLVNAVYDQLRNESYLICYPPASSYYYEDRGDARSDDPYAGPEGMAYSFYIQARNFYLWCGFADTSSRKQDPYHTPSDSLTLGIHEKPVLDGFIREAPAYLKPATFTPALRGALEALGFKGPLSWRKLYKIAVPDKTHVTVTEVVNGIKQAANALCLVWESPVKFIRVNARNLFFLAQSRYDLNLHYDLKAVAWLDGYIKEQRTLKRTVGLSNGDVSALIDRCGAYLGECIRFNYGGQWEISNHGWFLKFPGGQELFPFAPVEKALESGVSDSLLILFRSVPELFPEDVTRLPAQRLLEEGLAAVAARDRDAALSCFYKAILANPVYVQAYYHRGMLGSSRWEHSPYFTRALNLAPDLIDLYFERAWDYDQEEDRREILSDYDKVIQLNPAFRRAYFCRGWARERENAWYGAYQDFTKAIELNPDDPQGYYYRACAHPPSRDYDKAIPDLDKALELDPQHADACYARAWAYSALSQFEAAVRDFEQYLKLAPKSMHRDTVMRKIAELKRKLDEI